MADHSTTDTAPYGQTPTGKQAADQFNNAVSNAAAAAGTPVGGQAAGTDYFGRPLGVGSSGSFPSLPQTNIMQKGSNPDVWLGTQSPIAFSKLNDAANLYYTWDNKTRNQFLSQLSLAGYDTSGLRDADIAKLWGGYVGVAAQYQLQGKQLSPWDVLGKDISQRESVQPRQVTSTAKSYNISTYEDAYGLFQNITQHLLGRDPTKAETNGFKKIINKYEQANPTVTTYQSTYMGSQLQDKQITKTSGGVTAEARQAIAEQQAKQDPEYGAYQAATNGMNWLLAAIKGG